MLLFTDIFATIITVDVDFLAVVINFHDTGVAATSISVDFVSLTFVMNGIVFDVAVVFGIDVIADIFLYIEVIVIIIIMLLFYSHYY